jgi:hypothetical protein
MVRRAFLKISFFFGSTLALFGIDLFKMTKDIRAEEIIKPKITKTPTFIQTASSLSEAIRLGDANALLSSIQKNPEQAVSLSTQEKIAAINILQAQGTCTLNAKTAEQAAAILLSKSEQNQAELVAIMQATGGRKWLSERVLTIRNPDLKRICESVL